jgi:hypothetical protein
MIGMLNEWMPLGIDVVNWWVVRAAMSDAACYGASVVKRAAGCVLAVKVWRDEKAATNLQCLV